MAGGYINGTTEGAFTGGFLRCSSLPIGYSLSLVIGKYFNHPFLDYIKYIVLNLGISGGLFFAKPMREGRGGRGYVTMLDPFQVDESYQSSIWFLKINIL